MSCLVTLVDFKHDGQLMECLKMTALVDWRCFKGHTRVAVIAIKINNTFVILSTTSQFNFSCHKADRTF